MGTRVCHWTGTRMLRLSVSDRGGAAHAERRITGVAVGRLLGTRASGAGYRKK